MKPYWVSVGPNTSNQFPSKKRRGCDADVHRGEGHVKMETEIEVMLPQARNTKVCWKPPEARRGKERVFPTACRRSIALLTP